MDEVQQQLHFLLHGSPEQRDYAVSMLLAIGAPAVLPLCRAVIRLAEGAASSEILESGEGMSPQAAAWMERVGSPAPAVRARAAEELGQAKEPCSFSLIHSLLRDVDAEVRRAAIRALGELGDARAIPGLCSRLGDADFQAPYLAVEALGRFGAWGVPALVRALQSEYYVVRRKAAEVLGRLGAREALSPLCHALLDSDPGVRRAAALALGALSDPRAVAPLVVALDEGSSEVQEAAETALAHLGEAAVDALREELHHARRRRRAAAILARVAKAYPSRKLRNVVPVLRGLLERRAVRAPEERASLEASLRTIDAATAGMELPLPSEAGATSGEALPRPSHAGALPSRSLPWPSDGAEPLDG